MQIWGATTKTCTDTWTDLIQQLLIERYVPRILYKNSYLSKAYALITGAANKQVKYNNMLDNDKVDGMK